MIAALFIVVILILGWLVGSLLDRMADRMKLDTYENEVNEKGATK